MSPTAAPTNAHRIGPPLPQLSLGVAHLSPGLFALPLQQHLHLVPERRHPVRLVRTVSTKTIPRSCDGGLRGDDHVGLQPPREGEGTGAGRGGEGGWGGR